MYIGIVYSVCVLVCARVCVCCVCVLCVCACVVCVCVCVVCMCVVCVCVCVSVCMCVYLCVYVHVCMMRVHVYVCVCVFVGPCLSVCTRACAYVYLCVSVLHVCVCQYVITYFPVLFTLNSKPGIKIGGRMVNLYCTPPCEMSSTQVQSRYNYVFNLITYLNFRKFNYSNDDKNSNRSLFFGMHAICSW